jgi:hypothetical protein
MTAAVTPGREELVRALHSRFPRLFREYAPFEVVDWFLARLAANPTPPADTIAKPSDEGVREWRCFHCNEVFTDAAAAKEHFGPDTEWQAGCIDPLTKDEAERRQDQVDMYTELDREREENSRLMSRDYVLSCYERDLAKFFNGAKSVHQAFLVLDSIEGRALAAEEKLAALATTGEPKP